MKKSVYILSFLISLPFLSACESSDDLVGIFTGKSWALTDIIQGSNNFYKWGFEENATKEEKDESYALVLNGDNCFLTFGGSLIDETISGTYSGRTVAASFSDIEWSANQKKEFKSNFRENFTNNESDPLVKEFVYGLQHAERWGGDYNNLYIYYKTGGRERMLLFRQVKK